MREKVKHSFVLLLALHEMDSINLTDSKRWPIPLSDSLAASVVAERGTARSLWPIRSSQTRDVAGHEKDMRQLATLTARIWPAAKRPLK